MNHKKNILYSLLALSVFGVLVSFLLTREYFGNAGDLVSSLCSATGAEGACDKVKNSAYSGFQLPGIGAIPVALFGFLFYGFNSVLAFFALGSEEKAKSHISVILGLSLLGAVVDLVLLSISLFAIGAVCSLCAITYLITLGTLILSYLYLQKLSPEKGAISEMSQNFFSGIKLHFLNYTIIFLSFFACGLGLGRMSSGKSAHTVGNSDDMIKAGIEAYEKAPTVKLDLNGIPFNGDAKAPIVIVKYADYNCGHCMHTSHVLHSILAEFSGLVKVYYKNFPLDGNCNRLVQRKSPDASSCIAASAAYCGFKQNKFDAVYTAIYADTEQGIRHNPSSVRTIAQNVGLNMNAFQACMASPEIPAFIEKEVTEAEVLNIQSTPSVYVNNKPLAPGSPEPQFLRELIKHISKKL